MRNLRAGIFSLILAGIMSFLPVSAEEDGVIITEDREGNLVTQTIFTEGRFGVIEEQRVQSIQSEVSFSSPETGVSYNLVSENSRGNTISSHEDFDELFIPSWEVFSW